MNRLCHTEGEYLVSEHQDLLSRIEKLERDVAELRDTIQRLQLSPIPPLAPAVQPPAAESAPTAGQSEPRAAGMLDEPVLVFPGQPGSREPAGTRSAMAEKWEALQREGLENLIGGRLLNRIGIIVLMFAVAYFLKYSFDNNWIGPAGRIIIGYCAGIAFLAFGHYLMSKDYHYFSQGFSGGAIGIIYLCTFFAVGSYHLIGPYPAFGILVTTALAGGILSVRQSAYGVAFLAAMGGFLAPFLIGRAEPNTLGLFAYISILNLGVLFLARYKNWRSLNIIAFVATIAVYIAYQASLPWDWPDETWLFQGYATLFFLIFGALAFYYNAIHKETTRVADVFLAVLNAFAYFIASYANLDVQYHDLLGPLAIVLAAFYLGISWFLKRQGQGDALLHITLLGTGLAFVTAAIPLQLNEEWIYSAWLVEAVMVIFGGIRGRKPGLRTIGLLFLLLVSVIVFADSPHYMDYYYSDYAAVYYDLPHPFVLKPVFNYYFLSMLLAALAAVFAAFLYHTSEGLYKLERHLAWPLAIIGTIFALAALSTEVAYTIRYLGSSLSAEFAVSTSWVILAILVMALGMIRENKGIRFLALGLFGLVTAKVMLFDLSNLLIIFRVLILLIVGAILVAVSFVYQRKSKGDSEHHDLENLPE